MNRRGFLGAIAGVFAGFCAPPAMFESKPKPKKAKLRGYKRTSYLDSGYFYAPYIPIVQSPVVIDPESFTPNKGILTRYGRKLLDEGKQYYGKVSFNGSSVEAY